MTSQAGKRKRALYDNGDPTIEMVKAGDWTTAEDLIIINGSPDESDSGVSVIEMHKQMPHHSLNSVAIRYYRLTRQSMTQQDISRLWHMWLT